MLIDKEVSAVVDESKDGRGRIRKTCLECAKRDI